MSDDWKPGDLAGLASIETHCSDCHPDGSDDPRLKVGRAYVVTAVLPYPNEAPGLVLAEVPNPVPWCACRFRKIRPDDQAGSREDWVMLIETHKQRVEA